MNKYILMLVMIWGLWSCENFLTIRPKSDITEKELFRTAEGTEDALYGVYALLGRPALYGKTMTYLLPDALAQYYELDGTQGTNIYEAASFHHQSNDARSFYDGLWTNMYQAIGYTNNIINNLEEQDETSMKYYPVYLGEALGIRAFLHFDLLRLFAPHIVTKPDEPGIPYVRRWTSLVTPFSTVREVYISVIADLKEAERWLAQGMEKMDEGNDFTNLPLIHFNLYAAQAMLARVYWMKGDLDSACLYAQKVISNKQLELVEPTEVGNCMKQVIIAKEGIWGLYNTELTEEYKKVFYDAAGSYGDATYRPKNYTSLYVNEMGDNEMRLEWFKARVNDATATIRFMKLFREENMSLSQATYEEGLIPGVNLIRLSEMYLIVAEALLEKNPAMAREYFDTFVASRGLRTWKEKGKMVTPEDINEERRKEFIGEGQEFFNMKREMREVTLPTGETLKGSDEIYTLAIPDAEYEYRNDEE